MVNLNALGQPLFPREFMDFRLQKQLNSRANYLVLLRLVLFVTITLQLLSRPAFGFELAYWVWQREDPLSETELTELAAQNVQTIYWHIGELESVGQTWHWKTRFAFPPRNESQLHYVPVVRLISRERQPFSSAAVASLVTAFSSVSRFSDELQIDYDAPDRLLSDYAAAIQRIRQIVPHLTITALPHWSRPECLAQLQGSVDEFFPMLYDF